MKKMLFKKTLNILDDIERQGVSIDSAKQMILFELEKENFEVQFTEIDDIFQILLSIHMIKTTERGIDLHPSATIFAKSDHNSLLEALAYAECLIQNISDKDNLLNILKVNKWVKEEVGFTSWEKDDFHILRQTIFFEFNNHEVRVQPALVDNLMKIIHEYKEQPNLLLSVNLCANYTSSIIDFPYSSTEYKNIDKAIVPYKHLSTILDVLPNKGIPQERSETKRLQSFYKDTLFHEFDHRCPICGIDIPQMLIASHIKPFRDCAHIFEAIDHHNGLLLCRNHDFLFDQGYISFDVSGKILISDELLAKDYLLGPFVINEQFILDKKFMSETRKLFLKYHNDIIYKQ